MATRRVTILGSTGSIGVQTVAVIDHLNRLHEQGRFEDRIEIVALATGSRGQALADQARTLGVTQIAIANPDDAIDLPPGVTARQGPDAAERLVRDVPCDLVVCAVVGSAGLAPTLAAIELGHDIALANKETLVAGGEIVMPAARNSGSRILPIDSEHAAAWQLMQSLDSTYTPPSPAPPGVARLTLTASGGPFRDLPADQLRNVTPEQALQHPTWSMGPKNTIDSATLMNKALELIEARWLFDLSPDQLDAIIQPTSLVHALIETTDGSMLAQLSKPDMRLPIQQAVSHPLRAPACIEALDIRSMGDLSFQAIDETRFAGISLAREVMRRGGTAGAIFNAVNEIAVQAFLRRKLSFLGIAAVVQESLTQVPTSPVESLSDILEADANARRWALAQIGPFQDCTPSRP